MKKKKYSIKCPDVLLFLNFFIPQYIMIKNLKKFPIKCAV